MIEVRLLAGSEPWPAGCLAVGASPPEAALALDNHPGSRTPEAVRADTLAAQALRLTSRQRGLLAGITTACTRRTDADAVMALVLLRHDHLPISLGPTLVAAGAYDAFQAWSMDDGARLALALRALVCDERGRGGGFTERLTQRAIVDFHLLHDAARDGDRERDAQVEQILDLRSRLINQPNRCPVVLDHRPRLTCVRGLLTHGLHDDDGSSVHRPDDCPPWVLWDVVPAHQFQLWLFGDGQGTQVRLHAPRHAWAQTVRLPRVAVPDCRDLAARLQERESAPCHWAVGDGARALGPSCLLASVDGQGRPAASQLDLAAIEAAVLGLLRACPASPAAS